MVQDILNSNIWAVIHKVFGTIMYISLSTYIGFQDVPIITNGVDLKGYIGSSLLRKSQEYSFIKNFSRFLSYHFASSI